MKVARSEFGMITIYLISVVIYMIAMSMIGIGNAGDDIRYYAISIAIVYGFVQLFKRKKIFIGKKNNYGNEVRGIYIISVLFFILSVFQARKVGHSLGTRTYVQVILLLIPAMYSYCLLNLLSAKTIHNMMIMTLWLAVIFYIYEQGLFNFFVLSNWISISFLHSYSPFESSVYAGIFLVLFIYFYYILHEVKDKQLKNKVAYWMSFACTILTFKRLAIVFSVGMFIFGRFLDYKKQIPKILPEVTSIVFAFTTIIYTKFMQGELNILGIDTYSFSKGRDYILSLWEKYDYFSYGYGSSYELIGRYLEMDLVQIYLEIGIIAVLLFTWVYFRIARDSLYAYIILLFVFLNMLTASSIPMPLDWTLFLVVIASVSSGKINS